jgi:cell division initiation protein
MKNASGMKIAPIDIAHKTFSRKVMGLDADEVSDFLRDVADQMEELIRERNALKESFRQKDLQIMEFRERDDSLKATIATATKMSEQIRADSEREAKLIVNDAHQKAEMILKDSRDSLKRSYQEIADLKRSRMQFEVNIRSICQAHVAMLDQSHMMMPDPHVNMAQSQAQAQPHQTPNQNQYQNQQHQPAQSMMPQQAMHAMQRSPGPVGKA